jgi:hypothetical protein
MKILKHIVFCGHLCFYCWKPLTNNSSSKKKFVMKNLMFYFATSNYVTTKLKFNRLIGQPISKDFPNKMRWKRLSLFYNLKIHFNLLDLLRSCIHPGFPLETAVLGFGLKYRWLWLLVALKCLLFITIALLNLQV